jgi:hypothetical protein
MTFIVLSFIIAVASPGIGPAEKLILGTAVVGVLVAARPVRRLGSGCALRTAGLGCASGAASSAIGRGGYIALP